MYPHPVLCLSSKLQTIVTKGLGFFYLHICTHTFTSIHINTDSRDIKTCLSIFYISYFHRKPYLLHVQCSDLSVVPSFAVLAQYVLGKLPGCILNERERSYTGLQCLLHRGSPYSPLCCMSGFALYTRDCPITLETLLCGKTAKMWEGMRVAPLVMPSLSANFWVHFARRRLILRREEVRSLKFI